MGRRPGKKHQCTLFLWVRYTDGWHEYCAACGKSTGRIEKERPKDDPFYATMKSLESETVMERELRIGQHLVFIDAERQERDALLIAIHGDPKGRLSMPRRKPNPNPTRTDDTYIYEKDEDGNILYDYKEEGGHWPCVNLVIVDKNEGAHDQYGRQTVKENITSVVHWTDSSARGFCWRFADEEMSGERAPTIV